jgi:outer membrane protein OmpA-like peptidoglycan-associated protein
MKRSNSTGDQESNPFWLSISDLMSVLMLIFVFFTAAALVQLSENTVQSKIFAMLVEELKQVNIEVEINPEHGTISIADKILFNTDEAVLKDNGKEFLKNFLPILINVLFHSEEISSEIVSVDIEGYTSENFNNNIFRQKMMTLSLDRAESVWAYANQSDSLENKEKFLKKLKVCGWGNMKATSNTNNPMDRKVKFQLQFKGQLEKLKETLLQFTK